jgi:hypothetical protein
MLVLKPKSNAIILLKLVTGEEIIGQSIDTVEYFYQLKNTFMVNIVDDHTILIPWLKGALPTTTINIPVDRVIVPTVPSNEVVELYNKKVFDND